MEPLVVGESQANLPDVLPQPIQSEVVIHSIYLQIIYLAGCNEKNIDGSNETII